MGLHLSLPISSPDGAAANGNVEPVFYTDDQQMPFMVTLPCHPEFLVTKLSTKSGTKLSKVDVDAKFNQGVDIEALGTLLNNDVSEVVDYIREQLVTKSVTKLVTKLIDFMQEEKSREELFSFLGISSYIKGPRHFEC